MDNDITAADLFHASFVIMRQLGKDLTSLSGQLNLSPLLLTKLGF